MPSTNATDAAAYDVPDPTAWADWLVLGALVAVTLYFVVADAIAIFVVAHSYAAKGRVHPHSAAWFAEPMRYRNVMLIVLISAASLAHMWGMFVANNHMDHWADGELWWCT